MFVEFRVRQVSFFHERSRVFVWITENFGKENSIVNNRVNFRIEVGQIFQYVCLILQQVGFSTNHCFWKCGSCWNVHYVDCVSRDATCIWQDSHARSSRHLMQTEEEGCHIKAIVFPIRLRVSNLKLAPPSSPPFCFTNHVFARIDSEAWNPCGRTCSAAEIYDAETAGNALECDRSNILSIISCLVYDGRCESSKPRMQPTVS